MQNFHVPSRRAIIAICITSLFLGIILARVLLWTESVYNVCYLDSQQQPSKCHSDKACEIFGTSSLLP